MSLNPHISDDCVIFGFKKGIKVLLIEREKSLIVI
jgi:hypothetical protein